jgi:hypothetical protein
MGKRPLGDRPFLSSPRKSPNEEPTYLLVVIDAGLKLSSAWEAEAGWQGALATTGAPNVLGTELIRVGAGCRTICCSDCSHHHSQCMAAAQFRPCSHRLERVLAGAESAGSPPTERCVILTALPCRCLLHVLVGHTAAAFIAALHFLAHPLEAGLAAAAASGFLDCAFGQPGIILALPVFMFFLFLDLQE